MIAFGAVAAGVALVALSLALLAPASIAVRMVHPDAEVLSIALPSWTVLRWEAVRAALVALVLALHAPTVALLLAAIAPSLALRYRADTVRYRDAAGASVVLQRTHAALRSGVGIASALRAALDDTAPTLRAPFERALRSFDLNTRLVDALDTSRSGRIDARVAAALDALALVAHEDLSPTRAATLIAAAADRLAFEQRVRDEIDARASGVRWQITVLALLVPALAIYLVLTMPGLAATIASPLGTRVLVPIACALELAGIVASRAIVRGLVL